MRVLVACEFSGRVRDAFLACGHDAMSCDVLPSDNPGPHYQGDVRDVLGDSWDLMVAHPPCTFLANSGVHLLFKREGREEKMREAAKFFKLLLDAPIPRKAVENPIMHKYAVEIVGRRQDQVVQPWMFGHPEQKATCLWLEGLPPLVSTLDARPLMEGMSRFERQKLFYLGPSKDRAKKRSVTYSGIAEAMAVQWSGL